MTDSNQNPNCLLFKRVEVEYGAWQENTMANPFFKSSVPVEVKLKDGRTLLFNCPKCRKGMMLLVDEWRTVVEN